MHDRQPGAPGQYKMTVAASEAQKILAGETVTITLVRDDQPMAEGTPYNKASVLPDDLAAQICPDVVDPSPADAFRGLIGRKITATLTAAGWSSVAPYTQTIVAAGVLAADAPHITPVYSDTLATALEEKDAWAAVSEADAGDGIVTFTCFEDKPEVDIPIQIEVMR